MNSSANFNRWKITQLGNICDISSSKRIFANEYKSSGIPFYRGKEIIEKFNKKPISTELFISPERFNEINNKFGVPKEGDILLTSVGTLGIPYLVGNEDFYFKDGNLTWFKQFKSCNSRFLFFWFQSPFAKHQIETKSIGSTQKALTIDILKSFTIHLPPIKVQNKIVAILSSIDDKIELNNKINRNLEAQAQAIFKSWFEKIGNSKKVTLDYFCDIFTGKKNANAAVKNGKYKFFTCSPEILLTNTFIFDGPGIIISGNGSYTGRTRFFRGKFDLYQRTYVCTIKPIYQESYIYVLYLAAKTELEPKLMGGTHGSAIPYIVMNDIAKFELNYNEDVYLKLSKCLKPLVDNMLHNEIESQYLSILRNTLLPKLMSGEIDVTKITV